MQLPESRILVHIEILGIPGGLDPAFDMGPPGAPPVTPLEASTGGPKGGDFPGAGRALGRPSWGSVEYFTGPQFLSEHRELQPYTAVDAALLVCQRIAERFRHVWGSARVVLWEIQERDTEIETKVREKGGVFYLVLFVFILEWLLKE